MKFIFISLLISFTSFNPFEDTCDDLKFEVKVIHTTNGLDNGTIDVTVTKSSSEVKVFLYSEGENENKLDVKLDELNKLKSGTYMLVLQNSKCHAVKRDIIIK